MDIFGAFQLCSIGILAAPQTVKLSRTYLYDRSRGIIFLWAVLVLAGEHLPWSSFQGHANHQFLLPGVLSLTVEFFRTNASDCTHDESGHPISPTVGEFRYGTLCGLSCSVKDGPHSPLRRGSANNIYVIPSPDKLTFATATLLAAACCVPAILSLVSIWNKILKDNWKIHYGVEDETERAPSRLLELILRRIEIAIFVAAVLAILTIGERNFFSAQVFYQTEPIASIGRKSSLSVIITDR